MDQERINAIYSELDGIDFTLQDYNTPDEISLAIVHCRNKISAVSILAVEVQRSIASVRRAYKSTKKERLIKYNQLMRESEEVKQGKSGLDRQAIAESLLSDLDTSISDLECTLSDLKFLYEAINLRISNLNKTNSDIRLAWNIMSSSVPQIVDALKDPSPISVTEEDFSDFDLSTDISKLKGSEPKEEPKKEEPKKEKSKPSKKKSEEISEEGFGLSEEVDLDLSGEEIGAPVSLDSEPSSEDADSEKEDTTSDDVDIEDFLNDL